MGLRTPGALAARGGGATTAAPAIGVFTRTRAGTRGGRGLLGVSGVRAGAQSRGGRLRFCQSRMAPSWSTLPEKPAGRGRIASPGPRGMFHSMVS